MSTVGCKEPSLGATWGMLREVVSGLSFGDQHEQLGEGSMFSVSLELEQPLPT
jgi:hypothetical protein